MVLNALLCVFFATLRAETQSHIIHEHDVASRIHSASGAGSKAWSLHASLQKTGHPLMARSLNSKDVNETRIKSNGNETHANSAQGKLRGASDKIDSGSSTTKNRDSDTQGGFADVLDSSSATNVTEDVKYLSTCSGACNWCFKNFRTHCFAKCYRGCFRHCDQYDCTSRSVWYASPALQPKVNNPGYFICQSNKGRKRCPT
eukprot:gnl/MRDRNA2_/MRDRNA2_111872_c0_seq1.p1 gnl/MRDRNA2_/MRDRNA2_111872_c0~~gnl/MRDRNA2_/MRDRNA2_111872_c0_seq1.p1  ORF type:complete len:202 (+),score=17.30 gnl/MRDRNA2_/MRDRNA2_111872_c0_seq1:151-756(+)